MVLSQLHRPPAWPTCPISQVENLVRLFLVRSAELTGKGGRGQAYSGNVTLQSRSLVSGQAWMCSCALYPRAFDWQVCIQFLPQTSHAALPPPLPGSSHATICPPPPAAPVRVLQCHTILHTARHRVWIELLSGRPQMQTDLDGRGPGRRWWAVVTARRGAPVWLATGTATGGASSRGLGLRIWHSFYKIAIGVAYVAEFSSPQHIQLANTREREAGDQQRWAGQSLSRNHCASRL